MQSMINQCIMPFSDVGNAPSAIVNIRNISRDVECGTALNVVNFEWDPPTNIANISHISYYEIIIANNTLNFTETHYTVHSKLTGIISDGYYTINITAVNKCGERSPPTVSCFNVVNSCSSLNSQCQSEYVGWYTTSITLIVLLVFSLLPYSCLLLCCLICFKYYNEMESYL